MAKIEENKRLVLLLAVLALVYSAFFFVKPINLTTADLGRHITNGELVVNGLTDVLYRNFYSYTEPNHEFTNHHWGSGVLFYYIREWFGFKGLSVWYVLMNLIALIFMVKASKKNDPLVIPILVGLSVVSLLAYRVEIRPEGFSYALIAGYYFSFSKLKSNPDKFKFILPLLLLLQVFWVNIHIFFFLGITVAGAFWLDTLINRKDQIKNQSILVISLVLVSLINPHFHKGLLAPLTIFNEYGYMVAENQTILFMHERFGNPELYHFEIFGLLAVVLIILALIRKLWKENLPDLLLLTSFGILSAIAVRGIPLFALFFIPVATVVIESYLDKLDFKTKQTTFKLLPILGITFCVLFTGLKGTYASARKEFQSLGLIENINGCGEFLRKQQIQGRIFNNYDIGSYLIYHLHHREKVFVDNRPEAYSVAFFDSIYKPMQENDELWNQKMDEYNLNVICFFRHDNTPWAQPFLIRRTQDPNWVPIYVDMATLVLIRNRESNRLWIQRFGIDRSVFRSVPNS